MKIIKDNTIKETEPKEIKCPHCKSLLLVETGDYHRGYSWFINEIGQAEKGLFYDILTCPCCNREFRL